MCETKTKNEDLLSEVRLENFWIWTMKNQNIIARQKKNMEKLNRAQKCSILGPQNLGSRGPRAPASPPDPHL